MHIRPKSTHLGWVVLMNIEHPPSMLINGINAHRCNYSLSSESQPAVVAVAAQGSAPQRR